MIARRSAASRVPFGGSAALDAASAPCVASALTDGQPAGALALSCVVSLHEGGGLWTRNHTPVRAVVAFLVTAVARRLGSANPALTPEDGRETPLPLEPIRGRPQRRLSVAAPSPTQ